MALPTTLTASQFADLLHVEDVRFIQVFQQQRSATGGGDTHYADRAPALWRADITSIELLDAEAEGFMALINSRAGGIKTLLLHNYRLPYPRTDPKGLLIGSAVPVISAIEDRLHVAFSDFPAGYSLPFGTFFGAVFDGGRRYLGQLAEPRVAGPGGAVASVEVWPPLPASIGPGTAISVSKPPMKARIMPGSALPVSVGMLHTKIQFTAEQTYSR